MKKIIIKERDYPQKPEWRIVLDHLIYQDEIKVFRVKTAGRRPSDDRPKTIPRASDDSPTGKKFTKNEMPPTR